MTTAVSNAQKVAVITGAAGGIGACVAQRCLASGLRVALVDRDAGALEKLEGLEGTLGARPILADVTNRAHMEQAASTIASELGDVHVLFANAGIGPQGGISDTSGEDWDAVMAVNLTGVFHTIAAFVPHMLEVPGRRSIVVTSSVLAVRGAGNMLAYSAAKAGLIGLVEAAAQELAAKGITVNAIAPGPIRTPLLDAIAGESIGALERQVPVRRLGTPDDIASLVLFLTGSESGFITGQVIVIDGGLSGRAYWRDSS